jgi:cytochrome P450/NADPH-cytochrome P450 reductase
LVHDGLAKRGAQAIAPLGHADAVEGDIIGQFEAWQGDTLWPGISQAYGTTAVEGEEAGASAPLNVRILRPKTSPPKEKNAQVLGVQQLTHSPERPKYHMDIQLPAGAKYEAGDYIEVTPHNTAEDVDRAMRVLKLHGDEALAIESTTSTTLPTGLPLLARDLFKYYLELGQSASQRSIDALVKSCPIPEDKQRIQAWSSSPTRRPSVLQVLERFPLVPTTPLGDIIAMLPTLQPRAYSISSSPLASPANTCSITWSLIKHVTPPVGQGENTQPTLGLASHFLVNLRPGSTLPAVPKPGQRTFHLPADLAKTPMIMACAGTGLAPFRGFVQERAHLLQQDKTTSLAPALLFIGCRSPEDRMYEAELTAWEALGAVQVRYAYSRQADDSHGPLYVQDRLWAERAAVMELWGQGAVMYVCGSRAVNEGVKSAMKRAYEASEGAKGVVVTPGEVDEWWLRMRKERYAVDIF